MRQGRPPSSLGERRQLHQIILWHRLKMPSGLPPRRQTAHNHERVKSLFPQQVRHPGASRFACSSTVKINVLVLGQILDLLLEIVGLDADRAGDPLGTNVVVAVAAHVNDQHSVGFR